MHLHISCFCSERFPSAVNPTPQLKRGNSDLTEENSIKPDLDVYVKHVIKRGHRCQFNGPALDCDNVEFAASAADREHLADRMHNPGR